MARENDKFRLRGKILLAARLAPQTPSRYSVVMFRIVLTTVLFAIAGTAQAGLMRLTDIEGVPDGRSSSVVTAMSFHDEGLPDRSVYLSQDDGFGLDFSEVRGSVSNLEIGLCVSAGFLAKRYPVGFTSLATCGDLPRKMPGSLLRPV